LDGIYGADALATKAVQVFVKYFTADMERASCLVPLHRISDKEARELFIIIFNLLEFLETAVRDSIFESELLSAPVEQKVRRSGLPEKQSH
jgi:hypothetical protein